VGYNCGISEGCFTVASKFPTIYKEDQAIEINESHNACPQMEGTA
jgi:hypothetical protein